MTEVTDPRRKSHLQNLLETDGYALQIGLERQIVAAREQGRLRWSVTVREHPWRDRDGEERFVDLILTLGYVRMVIECKRTRPGRDWLFLQPGRELIEAVRSKCRWVMPGDGPVDWRAGVDDFRIVPSSLEAEFCSRASGQDEASQLEGIAGRLVRSVEALAEQDVALRSRGGEVLIYVPVIVTTAALHIARFDPGGVSLKDGVPDDADFHEVPMVRFRKTLATGGTPESPPKGLIESNKAKTRTVLVFNAEALVENLARFDLNRLDFKFPWEQG